MQLDKKALAQAKKHIHEAKTVVITNHLNPDGDAMGSATALAHVLRNMNKEVNIIVPNYFAANLRWMEGINQVLYFDQQAEKALPMIAEADIIFHLDYNALSRSGDMQKSLQESPATKVNIDHHQQPENFAQVNLCVPGASSTCEVLFHFLQQSELLPYLHRYGAESLYAGIITDTGNFRFNSTTSQTHHVVASLIDLGVKPDWVANKIYDNNRPERLKLLSRALGNLEIFPQYKASLMYLSANDLSELQFKKGDTEGFVNYGLTLEGIEVTGFFYPRDGGVKMSFRSLGSYDVNRMARQYFNGGGHVNAAGAYMEMTLEQALEKFKDVLPQFTPVPALDN